VAKQLAKSKPAEGSPSTFVPEFETKVDGGYPRIDVVKPYFLVFDPQRWTVMDGHVVPQLIRAPLEPGVNGFELREGKIRRAKWAERQEEQNRKVIPFDWAPDGNSYLQEVETRTNSGVKKTYISAWETAYVGDTETTTDTPAYVEWLRGLIAAGKLPACPPHILKRMVDKLSAALVEANVTQQKKASAEGARRIEALTASLEAARAAHENRPRGPAVKGSAATPTFDEGAE